MSVQILFELCIFHSGNLQILKKLSGICASGIIGGQHLGGERFAEPSGTAETSQHSAGF